MMKPLNCILFAVTFLLVSCGGDGPGDEPVEAQKLPIPAIASASVADGEATIRWNVVENARSYTCEISSDDGTVLRTESTRQTTFAFELEIGATRRFRVKALPVEGSLLWLESDYTAYQILTDGKLPAPVPSLDQVGTTSASISWSSVAQATSYQWELRRDDLTPALRTQTTTQTSVLLDELQPDTGYEFRVCALSEGQEGEPEWSVSIEFTTREQQIDPTVDLQLPLPGEDDGVIRAFPGAEGGGMYATGGRGGKVYHVTSLEDTGAEGTLRHAVESSGPRTVVFDVAGTITLRSALRIRNGDLTIAGQTAPGDGICLRNYTVVVDADNVVIRYMRFRLGDATKDDASPQEDCIWGRYHRNIILDHCSMSWSMDECASFYANCNFTMQWCLLTESLNNSGHPKGSHGYGGIWGGRNASFHHNMLANNKSRNARIDHPGIYGSYLTTHRGNVDYRNNVIYNWGDNSTYGGEDGHFNIVANYYKPGPASTRRAYFVDAYWYNSSSDVGSAYPRLWLDGNYHEGSYASQLNGDNWNGGVYFHSQGTDPSTSDARLSAPLTIRADDTKTCYTTTHTAADAFEAVLAHVGASLRRDAVDLRSVTDARSGSATYPSGGNGSTGGIIDTQSAVGGWPELTASGSDLERIADSDGDGIPDYYETLLNLDPGDAADGNTHTLDPRGLYTNLEVYLHYLVKDITLAQITGGAYTSLD